MSQFYSAFLANELLATAKSNFPKNLQWIGQSDLHEPIINFDNHDVHLEELDTITQIGKYDLVQAFFVNKGMDYTPPKLVFDDTIIAGLYLSIIAKWQYPGIQDSILKDGKNLDMANMMDAAVNSDKEGNLFAILHCDNNDNTYDGDKVIFEILSKETDSPSTIGQNGQNFLDSITSRTSKYEPYDGMVFPQAEVDISRDIDELNGIKLEGTNYVFGDAKGQCKLKINHVGALLEVAMYGGMTEESIPNPSWVIEDTYTVHFVRKNVLYCSVLITPDDFKRIEINF